MKKLLNNIGGFIRKHYRHFLALPALLLLIIGIKLFNFSVSDPVSDADYRNYFVSNYKVFGITIPKDLNFCGEAVPVTDFTVRESLERELMVNTYFQSQTLMYHKKASRWFPIIEPILKKNGIPDDCKYIALIESGLSNVVSPQKATGFWQLMEVTAGHCGLEMNDEIDERYHVEKSTEAACQVLKEAYEHYHNWTLAAASYNLGMGGVDKQLNKQQSGNYYDLYLNEETARYIFRILAVKEIISRPKSYGYQLRERDLYKPIPTYSVKVDSSVSDLAAFAIAQGSTYKILKVMNPWLLKSTLTNAQHKTYTIVFPKKGVNLYELDDQADSGLKDAVSDTSRFVTKAEIMADSASRPIIYAVGVNDSWESIAQKYGVEIDALLEWNKRDKNSKPEPGEELVIPKK
jgi:membrane-bound lytic murein transglycosylase D